MSDQQGTGAGGATGDPRVTKHMYRQVSLQGHPKKVPVDLPYMHTPKGSQLDCNWWFSYSNYFEFESYTFGSLQPQPCRPSLVAKRKTSMPGSVLLFVVVPTKQKCQ